MTEFELYDPRVSYDQLVCIEPDCSQTWERVIGAEKNITLQDCNKLVKTYKNSNKKRTAIARKFYERCELKYSEGDCTSNPSNIANLNSILFNISEYRSMLKSYVTNLKDEMCIRKYHQYARECSSEKKEGHIEFILGLETCLKKVEEKIRFVDGLSGMYEDAEISKLLADLVRFKHLFKPNNISRLIDEFNDNDLENFAETLSVLNTILLNWKEEYTANFNAIFDKYKEYRSKSTKVNKLLTSLETSAGNYEDINYENSKKKLDKAVDEMVVAVVTPKAVGKKTKKDKKEKKGQKPGKGNDDDFFSELEKFTKSTVEVTLTDDNFNIYYDEEKYEKYKSDLDFTFHLQVTCIFNNMRLLSRTIRVTLVVHDLDYDPKKTYHLNMNDFAHKRYITDNFEHIIDSSVFPTIMYGNPISQVAEINVGVKVDYVINECNVADVEDHISEWDDKKFEFRMLDMDTDLHVDIFRTTVSFPLLILSHIGSLTCNECQIVLSKITKDTTIFFLSPPTTKFDAHEFGLQVETFEFLIDIGVRDPCSKEYVGKLLCDKIPNRSCTICFLADY
jgi:hypothetical protein